MPIQSVSASAKTNLLLWGDPGCGKTTFIGTEPNTLIIRPPQDHTDAIEDPRVQEWVISTWSEMEEAFEYARHEAPGKHAWIWLDSISLWQDVGVDDIWDQVVAEKPHRAKYGRDKGEYGRNMERLAAWCRAMVALPGFNFGITAHPFTTDTPAGEMIFAPYVQGRNMPFKIAGMMNLVGLMRVQEKGRRVVDFNPTEDYIAHNKLGLFKPSGRLVDPTMPKLMAEIDAARARRSAAKRPAARGRRTTTKRR